MTLKVKDAGGVLRTITSMKVKDGAALRSISQMKVLDGATLRTVATFVPVMTASISPASSYHAGFPNPIVSTGITCTPGGGLGPYTYVWSILSGADVTINSGTSATATFSKFVASVGAPEDVVVRCIVTDSTGTTASATADLSFELLSPGGA